VPPALVATAAWLRRQAEHAVVFMLAAMFVAFLFQIVFRYFLGWPTGWAFEISIIAWIWVVLWGAAFVVREQDEIRFDIVYGLFPPGVRRASAVLTGVVLIALYGVSLPAVADYVAFMKVEKSAYLGIRFDLLYCVYVLFVVAVLVRYLWLVGRALRGHTPTTLVDPGAVDSSINSGR
jgi:C4-dicarboxylate transporter DctQ subunit